MGQEALGIDPPPMPDSWRGCTTTTEMRGDLVGAQTAPGKTSLKGTAALTLRGSVQGCEKTGANITASPPPEMKRVPWTGSGDENGLKGKITFPASAAIAPGTSWAFAVDSP